MAKGSCVYECIMDRLARKGLTEKVSFNERHDDSKRVGPADLGGEHLRVRKSKYKHVMLRPHPAWLMKGREENAAKGKWIRGVNNEGNSGKRPASLNRVFDLYPEWDGGLVEGTGQQDYSGCCIENILNRVKREKGGPIRVSCNHPGRGDGDQDQGGGNENLLNYEIFWRKLWQRYEEWEEPSTEWGIWPEILKEWDGHYLR